MDPILGEIKIFAGNFAPQGWFFCQGQLLNISQYTALFSLLGTTYGGDGRTTFGLPDLRGRVAVGPGQGPGLSPYTQGQKGGVETVTLVPQNLPPHTHQLSVANVNGVNAIPNPGDAIGVVNSGGRAPVTSNAFVNAQPNVALNAASVTGGGNSLPHENRQPYLAINYIIAWQGIYPQRP